MRIQRFHSELGGDTNSSKGRPLLASWTNCQQGPWAAGLGISAVIKLLVNLSSLDFKRSYSEKTARHSTYILATPGTN